MRFDSAPPRARRASLHWQSCVAFFLVSAAMTFAHDPVASWAVGRLQGDRFELKVELAAESVWLFMGQNLDVAPDVERALPRLRAKAADVYRLSHDGKALTPLETDVQLQEEDGVEFRLVFERPKTAVVRFDALYLQRLPSEHRTTLTIYGDDGKLVRSEILAPDNPTVEIRLPAAPGAEALSKSAGSRGPSSVVGTESPAAVSFSAFLKLGIEHILTGYDHLLFLLGLLVACRRLSSMLAIITCFTLAHSITLALAALQVVSISSRLVEALIAASIVFVGVENLVRREASRWRALLTFAFGLIHGFGFASVLRQVGLGTSGSALFVPLFSFNLGVEIGQLTVVGLALPLLWLLRTRPLFVRCGEPALSALVVILGAYWLLQRTVLS